MIDSRFMTARPIASVLAGQRILLTGATGFVGEALLERLLNDLPETPVTLLVRARGSLTATDRVRQVLAGPAFGRLRDRRGDDLSPLLDDHVRVLEGDLDNVPPLPGDLDIVIHCAGEVSFDPAIDDGFATNLHGTLNLLAAIDASGARPHYLHVSTAYVAGRQQGHIREGRLDHNVDWRAEADVAAQLRDRAEIASRSAEQLAIFTAQAETEHGSSGALSVSAEAERRRREWVSKTLVDAGRERGRSLGWTDCYTFTKAMAERAVEQTATHLPVTVLRPSIIESALAQPYPGWIEGFKMAEPIILAFGRGDLPDFPGIPDGVIDIIPVDLVVNATIAAAARVPEPGTPAYYTICSGARNPLSFGMLYELVREYFIAHPMVQRDRGEVRVPHWQFPGSERVDQLIRLADRAQRTTDRIVTSLPRSPRTRDWAKSLDRQRGRIDFLRRYFDLYRPYADAELHFSDQTTLALHESLHPDDVERFGFDATIIDWRYYLQDVHVPAVVTPLTALSAMRGPRIAPARSVVSGENIVAVFDMDGTLLSSNVVESYLWLRLPELAAPAKAREVTEVARALPRWLATQKKDRSAFLRMVYRRYEGASLADLERIVDEDITATMLTRLSSHAVRAIREHRAAGHRLVLVTGAVTPLTRPVAALFDEVVAAELSVDSFGRCTGHLELPPLVGESRAAWLRHRALAAGWDLAASYAYADSASDLPLLRAVGHPVVIDPDVVLSRVARKERWPVESWHSGARKARSLEPAR
ncbi:MAG TPA: HAD-IB family hydrolase [Mycobacteriales bacterium]|jgi:HAD superfamily hydrolase (TIGR01490 family)|nr:HAD-IB family hydrolase [Mycobacteriales bacterium]